MGFPLKTVIAPCSRLTFKEEDAGGLTQGLGRGWAWITAG